MCVHVHPVNVWAPEKGQFRRLLINTRVCSFPTAHVRWFCCLPPLTKRLLDICQLRKDLLAYCFPFQPGERKKVIIILLLGVKPPSVAFFDVLSFLVFFKCTLVCSLFYF